MVSFHGLSAAAILAAAQGSSSLSPWRWLFIIEGLPCFVVATVVMILLPKSPLACASFLSYEQHDWLIKYTTDIQEEKKKVSSNLADQHVSFWTVLRDPRVILLSLAAFFWDIGAWGLGFWLPQLLRNAGDGTKRSMVTVSLLAVSTCP